MNDLVSVVIPNHNNGRFLAEAIQSALDQTYRPVEVIVVDDGSTDESDTVGAHYRDRVTWIAQARAGVSAARNRGIEASAGAYVAFLDADDAWHPDKLARQLPRFAASAVGLVYCGVTFTDVDGRVIGESVAGPEGDILRATALLEPTVHAGGSTAVVRRSCLERVGGFDETLEVAEDWDLWRRIACAHQVAVVREPLVRSRQHPTNRHADVDRMHRNMQRAIDRMFADPAARAVHALRRRSLANFHLMLAGSYAHSRRWITAMREGLHAIALWPPITPTVITRTLTRGSRLSDDRRIAQAAQRASSKVD